MSGQLIPTLFTSLFSVYRHIVASGVYMVCIVESAFAVAAVSLDVNMTSAELPDTSKPNPGQALGKAQCGHPPCLLVRQAFKSESWVVDDCDMYF